MKETLAERFWRFAKPGSGDACWEWSGKRHPAGYGQFAHGGTTLKAHRVSWELHNGPIPKGLHCLHRCDNPPCVNPAHLFLGTNADNMRDRDAKGRLRKSPTHFASRTHCPKGHPYDESNTYKNPQGKRLCRTCLRAWAKSPRGLEYHRRYQREWKKRQTS